MRREAIHWVFAHTIEFKYERLRADTACGRRNYPLKRRLNIETIESDPLGLELETSFGIR